MHSHVRGALGAAVLGLVILTGCSGNATSASGEGGARPTNGSVPAANPDTGTLAVPATGKDASAATLSAALPDRSIISRASLTVRVKDVRAAARDAATRAEGAGGLVAGEQTKAEPEHPELGSAVLTLRVPADRLETMLSQLAGLGELVTQDQSAEDVTTQVIDVAARLRSQQASVDRIRLLLSRAKTIGEIVAIESELSQREAAVESLAAQAKALGDETALATITATFIGTAADVAPPVEATGFVAGLRRGWHSFAESASWLLTGLGTLVPFVVLALLVGIPLRVLLRRRQRTVVA